MTYLALAFAIGCGVTMPLIFAAIANEIQLQRMAKDGWLVSYGITGKPADLDRQIRDLTIKHAQATAVSGRPTVNPFPGHSNRNGEAS